MGQACEICNIFFDHNQNSILIPIYLKRKEEQKTVNDTIQMQAKLLKEWQKALREKEQTISALRADVAFLKQVLAQSMEQNGRSVLIRENSSHSAPQFALEENIGGETILRLL